MIPKIVIVGRPNVGKSSLLNMLAGRRVSIVDPTAGVTRDRITTRITIPNRKADQPDHVLDVVDTGGYGIEDTDNLTADVERQIANGLAEADVVLFIIDAQTGIVPLDETVARLLRSGNARVPIVLVANKVDSEKFEADAMEATSLGFGVPVCVSATSGYHKNDLFDAIRNNVRFDRLTAEESASDADHGILLAIVGKRNAGKSTLTNSLAGSDRVIVSEIEGTTRDSVDVRFEVDDKVFTAIDTAGVRKRKSVQNDIEYYSLHRALRSIRRAHVVLLILDATVPISQVDKQLVNEILKHHRPCVIVINKWDMVDDDHSQEAFAEYLDDALKGLSFAPIAFISAAKDEGIHELLAMAYNLYQQAQHRVSTSELNQAMEAILAEKTPTSRVGKYPKVYYATQLDINPPTIGLFVNDPEMFDPSYQRFLDNRFRDMLPFSEVPIKLIIRPRKRTPWELRDQTEQE